MYTLIIFKSNSENSDFPIYVNQKLLKAIESSFSVLESTNDYYSYVITDEEKRIESMEYYYTQDEIKNIKLASIPIIPQMIKEFLDSIINILDNFFIINLIPFDERGTYISYDNVQPIFSESYCENKFYWIRSYNEERYTRNSPNSNLYIHVEIDKENPFIDDVKILSLTEQEIADYEEDYRQDNIDENDDYENEFFIIAVTEK